MEIKIDIKPLSVNFAWKGRRFKTDKYKQYERDCLFLLPRFTIGKPPYKIYLEFGFSNMGADIDNPVKLFLDITQKKYNFNDKDIIEAHIKKVKTEKGKEYIKFEIQTIE
ncbi:MAG: hypothetical protein IIC76_14030 [Bacteroidetes bacterium]|nr:hypothetical protein [Bacteroidota bacterium]